MKRLKTNHSRVGWVMFTLSGVLFLIQAVRVGDWLTAAGAVAWLIGVGFFLLD